MANLILEQYGIQKLKQLEKSPYQVLFDSNIDYTPHQVEAFLAAIESLESGGIILADEVGLGKTIEAGLVIKYLIKNGAKRILIAVPNSLRKQWQDELAEKFNIKAYIPGSKYAVNYTENDFWRFKFQNKSEPMVVIMQYGMVDFFVNKFSHVSWDCFVFDEAHRLRNLGNGAKMPERVFRATKGVPKLMLSATPLQNNLRELFALSKYIDEDIFVDEATFNIHFTNNENYKALKETIKPFIQRTLRRDVAEYMKFSNRNSFLIDFQLTPEEYNLYNLANKYLQKPMLYAVTSQNNGLVKMVVRKLLASSSFAVVETFEKLKDRLLILKESTRVEKADTSLSSFFEMLGLDDVDSDDYEDDINEIERVKYKQQILMELKEVENIIQVASTIKENSKSKAVLEALQFAFELQTDKGYSRKALIFTESKRTQKYLVNTLKNAGFNKLLVFNGEMSDPETKKIFNAWRARNPKKVSNSPSVDLKQAIVEEFRDNAEILVATDVASEGLNLQFCDTVINYDLPWNPMKIEQRIGRCHRYGQTRDVNVFNLLNRENVADKRVYEILDIKFNLFKGVFGASDDALGLLESGSSFERIIQEIYDTCKTEEEFKKAFEELERNLDKGRNNKGKELKEILISISSDEKKKNLRKQERAMSGYLKQVEQWEEISRNLNPLVQKTILLKNKEIIKSQNTSINGGYLFVGSYSNSETGEFLLPSLCLFDLGGNLITTDSYYVLQMFKDIPRSEFVHYNPSSYELRTIHKMYKTLPSKMKEEYINMNELSIIKNEKKLKKWVKNRIDKYESDTNELREKVSLLWQKHRESRYLEEKKHIQKEIDRINKNINKREDEEEIKKQQIKVEFKNQHNEYKKKFDIKGIFNPNIVVKF